MSFTGSIVQRKPQFAANFVVWPVRAGGLAVAMLTFALVVGGGGTPAPRAELAVEYAADESSVNGYAQLKEIEHELVVKTLQKTNYKIYGADGAAAILGTKPTTLISRIKAMKIPMRPS